VIWPLVLVKVVQCLIVVALLLATRRVHESRALAWIGAVALGGIYFTTATSGLLRDEVLTSILLLLATVMATASFIPWSTWPQLLTAVCAAIALAGGRVLMPLPLYQHVEGTADATAYRQRFGELAAEGNFILHDPLDDLHGYDLETRRSFRFRKDVHLTPAGHRAIAQSLSKTLRPLLAAAPASG
jgi:hypothetical protein